MRNLSSGWGVIWVLRVNSLRTPNTALIICSLLTHSPHLLKLPTHLTFRTTNYSSNNYSLLLLLTTHNSKYWLISQQLWTKYTTDSKLLTAYPTTTHNVNYTISTVNGQFLPLRRDRVPLHKGGGFRRRCRVLVSSKKVKMALSTVGSRCLVLYKVWTQCFKVSPKVPSSG